MTSNWETVRLGDVLERSVERLGSAEEPTILTCTENDGLVDQLVHMGRRLATEDLSKYKTVKPMDIVYNVYLLWLGSIGQNHTGSQGVTSPVYEVFHPKGRAHPPFLGLLLRSPKMVERYREISIGTVPRRRRTPWEGFLALEISLPPFAEQQRIVDLISALDDLIEAADDAADKSSSALNSYLDGIQAPLVRPLGERATLRSGPSWKSTDESSTPVDGGDPVLGITNTPAGKEIDLTVKKYVSSLPKSTMRATANSLVMIRTNGNRARIGNIYRATREIQGFAVSAFQILIEPNDANDAALIYWSLSAPSMQRRITDAASGSTGLGNVAVGWLKNLELPMFKDSEGAEFLCTVDALDSMAQASLIHAKSLRKLRSEILTSLLSGAHTIPESYDEIMIAHREKMNA